MSKLVPIVLAALTTSCGPLLGEFPDAGRRPVSDAGSTTADTGVARIDCGDIRPWDSDGDGISDRVEQNNGSNGYADLLDGRCDQDPSEARGTPGSGTLLDGLNLPDRNTGYHHFYGTDGVDTDDWGVLPLLKCVEAAGRALADQGIPVQIGDMSLREGGVFPPHTGHQNGLEGDLRYVRIDRNRVPLDLRIEPEAYDADATRTLFEVLFNVCPVDFILVDRERIDFILDEQDDRIFDSSGHANHFHIRIRGS